MNLLPHFPAAALIASIALAWAAPAAAQGEAARSPWTFGATASALAFDDAGLEGGGSVRLRSAGVALSAAYGPSPFASAGLSLSAVEHRFDFSGTGGIASLAPWSDVRLTTLSAPLRTAFDRQWSVAFVPSVQIARTNEGSHDDDTRYGGVLSLSYSAAPRRFVGVGVSYFTGLDDDTVIPIVVVDWQIDDQWRLGNPLQAGPTGPAGLELVRTFGGGWEVGVGGAYRSLRFRLADDAAAAPGGTGSYSAALGFARFQYRFGPQLSLSLWAGADFNGEIEVNAKGGRTLVSEDVDTSPVLALSLSGRF